MDVKNFFPQVSRYCLFSTFFPFKVLKIVLDIFVQKLYNIPYDKSKNNNQNMGSY